MSLIRKTVKRLHYPADVIAQCVRGYLAYSLSWRNLEKMMAVRGVVAGHSPLHFIDGRKHTAINIMTAGSNPGCRHIDGHNPETVLENHLFQAVPVLPRLVSKRTPIPVCAATVAKREERWNR